MGQTKNNMAAENLAANRNYKSTVFAMLFGDRERFLNINWNHDRKLMEACQDLKDYAEYVDRVRKYAKRIPWQRL